MQFSITSILMFTVGIFLFVASVILAGTVNRFFKSRVSALVVGIIGLLIFFIGKYLFYILDYVQGAQPPQMPTAGLDDEAWQRIVRARLYLIYLPDLLLLLLSLALVFDRTKNVAKIIAPYALFFGMIHLVCGTFSNSQFSYGESLVNEGAWYKYIFECDGILRMGAIGFIYLVVVSTWTLIACREYSRWAILATVLIAIPLFLYPYEVQLVPDFNVGANCMTPVAFVGLSDRPSWPTDKYFPNYFALFSSFCLVPPVGDVTNGISYVKTYDNVTRLGHAVVYLIPILGSFVTIFFTCLFKNIFTRDIRRVNYIYKPWYYKSKVFNNVCSAIDARINDKIVEHIKTPYLYGFLNKDMKRIEAYAKYLKRQKAPSYIDPTKVSEVAAKLEAKQNSKNNKKQAKQNKDRIEKIEKTIRKEERTTQPNQTTAIQPQQTQQLSLNTMAQEWTDDNGVNWGLDANGNYFYKQNEQWIAYQAA